MKIPQFGFVWSVGTVVSVRREGSDVSERWHPVGRGSLELWSVRHCWNCSPWGWQRHFHRRCQPLLQYCFGLPETGVLEECSPSGWGVHWKMLKRQRRRGCLEVHCCPLAAPAGLDHRHGGASPSLCVGRRSHSSVPCCSHCMSHWLFSRSSSSSGETVGRELGDKNKSLFCPRIAQSFT